MQESTSPWLVRHLLQETQSTQRPLIAVECQQTVKEVMELLHRHRIQACPVRTAHTDQFVNGEQEFCLVHGWLYIGIVSQLDLLLFMHRHGESGGQVPVSRVLGQTSESQSLWTCRTDQPLLDMLELMAKGVHRVLVLPAQFNHPQDPKIDKDVHFLTQTDMLRFLKSWLFSPAGVQDQSHHRQLCHQAIQELGLVDPSKKGATVHSVYNHTPLADCLQLMAQYQLQSVPIVDVLCKRIIGTLSVTDLTAPLALRYLSQNVNTEQRKAEQVGDVIRELKQRPVYDSLPPDRVCTGKNTIIELFQLFFPEDPEGKMKHTVHRLWVVDASQGNPSVPDHQLPQHIVEEEEDFYEVAIPASEPASLPQLSIQSLQASWQHRPLIGVVSMSDLIRACWMILKRP